MLEKRKSWIGHILRRNVLMRGSIREEDELEELNERIPAGRRGGGNVPTKK